MHRICDMAYIRGNANNSRRKRVTLDLMGSLANTTLVEFRTLCGYGPMGAFTYHAENAELAGASRSSPETKRAPKESNEAVIAGSAASQMHAAMSNKLKRGKNE